IDRFLQFGLCYEMLMENISMYAIMNDNLDIIIYMDKMNGYYHSNLPRNVVTDFNGVLNSLVAVKYGSIKCLTYLEENGSLIDRFLYDKCTNEIYLVDNPEIIDLENVKHMERDIYPITARSGSIECLK